MWLNVPGFLCGDCSERVTVLSAGGTSDAGSSSLAECCETVPSRTDRSLLRFLCLRPSMTENVHVACSFLFENFFAVDKSSSRHTVHVKL